MEKNGKGSEEQSETCELSSTRCELEAARNIIQEQAALIEKLKKAVCKVKLFHDELVALRNEKLFLHELRKKRSASNILTSFDHSS
jgi:predicted nuclease with TOPRIM domain